MTARCISSDRFVNVIENTTRCSIIVVVVGLMVVVLVTFVPRVEIGDFVSSLVTIL